MRKSRLRAVESLPLVSLVADFNTITAVCTCGWRGPGRHGVSGYDDAETDADSHCAESEHERLGTEHVADHADLEPPSGQWFHPNCGAVHSWLTPCPTGATSASGRIRRIRQPVLGKPELVATDRLAAIHELSQWLDQERKEALIWARLRKVSWAHIGQACGGLSRQAAFNRWGKLIKNLEDIELLDRPDQTAHPPLDPAWEGTAIGWCRWCGNRIGLQPDSVRPHWFHCHPTDGPSTAIDTDCPGEEPWPADDQWPG